MKCSSYIYLAALGSDLFILKVQKASKKYYLACELFGETITIDIPQNIGDDIYERFKTRFEGNYSIKYV
jgi:hypothetical protein